MTKAMIGAIGMAVAVSAIAPGAWAQQAQYSSKDIIDSFAKKPAAEPALGECEKRGMVTGDDGVCEPTKDSRGFSLPTRATLHATSSSTMHASTSTSTMTSTSPPPTVHAPTRPTRLAMITRPAPAPATHRDLLITFKTGSSELTDQAKVNAKVFADALNSPSLSDSRFDLSGYTDAVGDKDKNLALSQARAAAVKDYLVAQGVSDARLTAHGYGASDFALPSVPNSPKNRRVEAKRAD